MASNLLDAIRSNSQPQQQGVTDETNKLQTLLRAKSGKAVSGGPVAASALGETRADVSTNQQLGQVAGQAAIQQQGLQQQQAGQEQQEQEQTAEIAQNRKFDNMQTRLQTDSLLSQFERNKGQLNLDKDKANVEQLGINLRLQDKQYVDNLQMEGQKARLDDDNSFKQELLKTQLGDAQEVLEKNLGNRSILDTNDRDFSKAMAQMGIDDAWALLRSNQRASEQTAMYTGAGSVASAGIGAYGKMQDKEDKKKDEE